MSIDEKPKRKRSIQIAATLITAIATTMTVTGCSHTETGRCVDQYGRIIPDSYCQGTYTGGSYHYPHYPHWVYGGRVRNGYAVGYSTHVPSGSRVVSPTGSVIRGGFGGFGGHGFGRGS